MPFTFLPNIPAATDLISTSQSEIQENFQFLGDTAGNAANPGFYRFPNGLLIQWGIELNASSGNHTKTFPIAYTTTYTVQLTPANDSSGSKFISLNQSAGTFTNTDFFYRVSSSGQDVVWFSVGLE